MTEKPNRETLTQIISRLERLSADSAWAHKAAGLRGSLLAALAAIDAGEEPSSDLSIWIEQGFAILVQSAKEIPGDD